MQVVHAARFESLQVESSSPPTEFRLFQFGENKSSKGTFKLDTDGAKAIMAAYRDAGVDLAIDYEHQTFQSASNGKPAPAAGWANLEARSDGIWATNVRWTDAAAKMLRAKEYRYFSPVFGVDKSNRIISVRPLALTNFPASKEQQALIAAKADLATQPTLEKSHMNIATLIGLKEDAPEGDVEGRVVALARNEARLLEVTGKDNVADAIGEVIAAKDSALRLEAAERELHELHETRSTEEQTVKTKQIVSLVASAVDSKRYGVSREEFVKMLTAHGEEHGVEKLSTLIASYPTKVRQYQAPAPVNTEAAQKAAIDEYKKSHPGASAGEAMVALAAERPSLFPEYQGGR